MADVACCRALRKQGVRNVASPYRDAECVGPAFRMRVANAHQYVRCFLFVRKPRTDELEIEAEIIHRDPLLTLHTGAAAKV